MLFRSEGGERRIPIIIGGLEAQAIAIELEGLKPPRPLTHDLFFKCLTIFNINLIEVNIYKIEEGIFYSNLVMLNGKETVQVDARTSDAIAIALRFKCPIFTTEEIMTKVGIVLNNETDLKDKTEKKPHAKPDKKPDFLNLEDAELNLLLEESIRNEDYEKASKIRDELKKREKKK